MKSYPIPLPEKSLIKNSLPRNDYEDAFAVEMQYPVPLAELPKLFFIAFPTWFIVLMGIRETVAKLIGLKTSHGMDVKKQIKEFKGEVGESISLFHVMGKTEEEIMTGESDSHLDFRMSLFSRVKKDKHEMIIATTVQYNNWVGRVYFFFVKPIHRMVMPILLKRMNRLVEKKMGKIITA